MNIEQADNLCHNTNGMIQNMESVLEAMKANGLPKYEQIIVNRAIDKIFTLNQKYVKLRDEKDSRYKP